MLEKFLEHAAKKEREFDESNERNEEESHQQLQNSTRLKSFDCLNS
jgi:hypothetical protein